MPLASIRGVSPQALVLLSQYALNFGLVGIRENLVRYLILISLRDTHENLQLSVSQISSRIAELLNLETLHYPDAIIAEHLSVLLNEDKVRQNRDTYFVTESTLAQLGHDYESAEQIHSAVRERVFSQLGKPQSLSERDKAIISEALYSFLGHIFAVDGERFASMFLELKVSESSLAGIPDFRRHLANIGRAKIRDEALRQRFVELVATELGSVDAVWRDFLGTIAQCYRILATLNLAPDINKIEFERVRDLFSDARIYVDTNVVLGLLLPDLPFHATDVSVIKHCQELGIKFLITEMTKQETLRQLGRDEHLVRRVPPIPPGLLPKVVDLIEEPFVRGYYRALMEKPHLQWEYFFGRLGEVDDLLKNLYGIEYDSATLDDQLRSSDVFETTVLQVMDLFEQMRQREKGWESAEHDAFHFLYLARLQSESANPVCFLTADRTLAFLPSRVPEVAAERFALYGKDLLDLALPFMQPKLAQKSTAQIYGDYFASHFVTAVGKTVPVQVLTRLLRPWMEHEGLSSDNIVQILRRTYVGKVLNKRRDQVALVEEEKQMIEEALIESLKAEMEKKKDVELERLYQRLRAETEQEVARRVEAIEATHKESVRINTEIVRHLAERGISSLADISIATSLLLDEVCRGVAELANYDFVRVHGTAGKDFASLMRFALDPKAKVRLSRKGHIAAPTYLAKAKA